MLSIYRDSSGRTVVDVADCESVREVKTVKMTDLGLTDFDQQMFSQMKNIEEMDISGNKLDTIPDYISLPKLKRLNCSRNRFTDITFVRQFPNLEEMDIRYNNISFSDHCIACELCPNLRRVNEQEVNIDKLKAKLEGRLQPLISRVWLDHFMSTFDDRMTVEEFDAVGEKFRTILKHSNIAVTKVIMKFKDFKLMQLVDRFLKAIRESSEGALFGVSNCTTERSQKSYAAKKAAQPQPAAPEGSDGPGESSAAEAEDPAAQDSTMYVLAGDQEGFSVDSDTVYILTEECDIDGPSEVMILTGGSERELRAMVEKDIARTEVTEDQAQTVEGRVTKFLPGPISWADPHKEKEEEEELQPSAPVSPVAVIQPKKGQKAPEAAKKTKPSEVPKTTKPSEAVAVTAKPAKTQPSEAAASDGQPKVVKYWLYDEEVKPLRKKKKPFAKPPSKRPDLSKYIVGPASEFSLASRRAAAATADAAALADAADSEALADAADAEATVILEDLADATVLPDADLTKMAVVNIPNEPTTVVVDVPAAPVKLDEQHVVKEDAVTEEVVLFDLWSDLPHESESDSEVVEEVVVLDENNHVSEAALLLDLSQSRPAAELMEVCEVNDAAEQDGQDKAGREREEPDKELRVPPKKRVRFLDEVQEGTAETECANDAEPGLERPCVAEET